jgi:hypothetical protein
MARYSVGWTKTFAVASGLISQLHTPASKDARVWEIGLWAGGTFATALEVQLTRPSAFGSAWTSGGTPQPDDTSAGSSTVLCDVAATAGTFTAGTNPFRRIFFPATPGVGVIWTFPAGLVIPTSAALALSTPTSSSDVFYGYYTYEE